MVTLTNTQSLSPPRSGRAAPIAVLLLLAPIIGEVLSGATRVSYLFVLVPQVMVWGCGALIIRELTRRWRGGITTLVLLGLALAVAEEFVIQQTSLAPLPWLTDQVPYSRAFGVNWLYFLYMLGYETVWIVLVPVLVTELIFPARRGEPWLRTRGLMIAGAIFVVGSVIAWFLWVKQARVHVFNAPDYTPPAITIAIGVIAIALLAWAAYATRRTPPPPNAASAAPAPLTVGIATVLLGLPWYALITLVFVPTPSVPFLVPLFAGIAWALLAYVVLVRWASAPGWTAMHGWALAFGGMLVNMSGGFLGSSYWPAIDLYGKIVLNVVAIALMLLLARAVSLRSQ